VAPRSVEHARPGPTHHRLPRHRRGDPGKRVHADHTRLEQSGCGLQNPGGTRHIVSILAWNEILYRVGPTCETWPNNLTDNLDQSPKVGPQSGPTLSNLRPCLRARAPGRSRQPAAGRGVPQARARCRRCWRRSRAGPSSSARGRSRSSPRACPPPTARTCASHRARAPSPAPVEFIRTAPLHHHLWHAGPAVPSPPARRASIAAPRLSQPPRLAAWPRTAAANLH
jgi:hypothetical protein